VRTGGVSADLAWWRAHRDLAARDTAVMGEALGRLQAWKAQHDQDRARQLGFLQMAWDAVFGDEDEQVAKAIGELEAGLVPKQQNTSAKTGGATGPAKP
jgi:hypothetical protein